MTDNHDSVIPKITLNNHETSHPLINNNSNDCETAEEAIDSRECLPENLRFRNFQTATMLTPAESNEQTSNGNAEIQIPIVGYEIMEERARFTVYKLKVENRTTGDCWYVFRRYTDFVRLCNKMRNSHPHVAQFLPRKRWLKNNFDPLFLEERINGLQALVNAILNEPRLVELQDIQDFFCLNEPPVCSESNEESRAMLEALEETVNDLRQQLKNNESLIDSLQGSLHLKTLENENLKKVIRTSMMNCQKCQKDYENLMKTLK